MYYYNLGLFAKTIATTYADRPALRYEDRTLTYADLANAQVRLARILLANTHSTVGPVVAIAHTKQPLAYALMLACLSLGFPYVILDASAPRARTEKILATAQPAMIFADTPDAAKSLDELAKCRTIPLLLLEEHTDIFAPLSPQETSVKAELAERTAAVDGATIAYIMFTSGSTGIPKGVAVTHQNVLHFITWGTGYFSIVPEDIFANVSPMYFDNSVFDFYCALFSGASLAPIAKELLTDPRALIPSVAKRACTIWFSVPSLLIYLMTMKVFRPEQLPHLRSISFGGEGYPKVELQKLYALFAKQARIINVYGPTECTCICSAYPLHDEDFTDTEGLPPLGHCNQNFDWFIEDETHDRAAADYENLSGELVLVGPNVAAGYYNDPERTEASFGTLVSKERFGKRYYRTGDLVRADKGQLFFLGRKDNQIKHMGYRIELEEIEHALLLLPGIRQAAVCYVRTQTAFGKLYAFAAYDGNATSRELLAALAEHIPSYMIPHTLTLLPDLPKNANGKIDKQALKAQI